MMEAAELVHKYTDKVGMYKADAFPQGLYKIRIPKGTKTWATSMPIGLLPVPCSALLRMDAPPARLDAVEMGPDSRNAIERLWNGETLFCYTPAESGVLVLSQGNMQSTWTANADRWLYIDFNFGNYLCHSWWSQIYLADSVPAPTPAPDIALVEKTQKLVVEVGLVQSMFKLSGCTNNAEFEKKAVESGVWPGLIEMVRLAGLK